MEEFLNEDFTSTNGQVTDVQLIQRLVQHIQQRWGDDEGSLPGTYRTLLSNLAKSYGGVSGYLQVTKTTTLPQLRVLII